jgi:hypothetical protein
MNELLKKVQGRVCVMLDIETLGVERDSVIAHIAAVEFDFLTGRIGSVFEDSIDCYLSERIGFKVDADTVVWRDKLPEHAQEQWHGTKQPIEVAIYLIDWFRRLSKTGKVVVFGNGADFDTKLLEYWFNHLGYKAPWDDFCVRDVRTIVDMGYLMGIDPKHTLEFEGTPHMALDDAKHQIRYVTEIVKKAMEVGERENG